MLRANRLPAVRPCLLFLVALLSSAIVLATSANPSRAAAASLPAAGSSAHFAHSASKRPSRRKSSSAQRADCADARTKKARMACAVRKAKVTKTSASPKPAVGAPSSPPSVAITSALAPAIPGPLLAEALAVPTPQFTTPAESPGGSDKPPGEPKPPVESKTPIEPTPPVEESKPPAEEPTLPVEESEEPKLPVEEPKPPVDAPPTGKAPTSTTLVSSANPSTVGQAVTYTATISALAPTGTVEFKDGDVVIPGCADQVVSFSIATCTVASYAPPGEYTITAAYSGDNNYLTSASSSLTQTALPNLSENEVAGKKATTTSVSSSSNPSTVGQSVTYTATVSSAAATGVVAFDEAGTPIAGCTARSVSSGIATCTVANLVAGGHWITAVYYGDSNNLESASPGLTQTVNKKTTTTMVSSSLDPSTVGEGVTYTAAVAPATATGAVTFDEAGKPILGCTARSVSSGIAKCTVTNLVAGGHWITAVYSGDSKYATSTSSGLTQAVNKRATATKVASSLDPSTVGQSVTYTATVSSAAATGAVTFDEAGTPIAGCTARSVSSGIATCTVANLVAGGHWITAVYSGDSNYDISTSSGLTQTVNKKATTTAMSSSLNPSIVGDGVTYTATLNTTAATGSVTFQDGGTTIPGCNAQIVNTGNATCTLVNPTAGGHWIKATYNGDNDYTSSSSSGMTQTINKKTTTTAVASSLDPSTVGQSVTYTATVSSAAATGAVTFDEAGTPIVGCTARSVSSGIATCTVTDLVAGGHWITAVYSGDSNYDTSTSPGLTQTVNKKTTTMAVSSSLNPSIVGEGVTYTATVSPAEATGTVAFDEAGTPIAGCAVQPISSGTATCTVPSYSAWSSYFISVAYSGDINNLTSVSPVLTQTVEPPPVGSEGPFRFFSPSSFWNEELPADAPVDPTSGAVVGAFDEEVAAEEQANRGPWINTVTYSVPIYTVPANQPTVKVRVTTENVWATPALQAAWDAVPLPAEAKPAAGTDKHLVVWQPSTGRLWEFWHLEQASGGWQAAWGGAIEKASSDSGVYGPEAWSGAETDWGASASSLSIAGGLITLEDLEKGQINHALAMAAPDVRGGVFASPARRTDGTSTDQLSLPEGAHLRLDPTLDLASLHLPRLTLMMAEAAQRYGIYVRDSGEIACFYAQDPTPTGTEPYGGPHGYFEGKYPNQVLADFPWSHLQLLKMELHSTS